jgi:transaldolase
MLVDGGDAEAVLADFAAEGVNAQTLAADLQRKGTAAFAKPWSELMLRIASKRGRP